MRSKLIRAISYMIIVVCGVICTTTIKNIINSREIRSVEVSKQESLNSFINNDLSNFEQTKQFDRNIESFMRKWGLKGASFALMRNDSLIYCKGYGVASDTLKCDASNLFRVASVSKLITATTIMKLIERGKVTLKSHVFGSGGILCDSIFLDLNSNNHKKITVEHLLRHTSGFTTSLGDPAFSNPTVAERLGKKLPLSLDDMVLFATKSRLRGVPGDRYEYSNLGYIVLEKVIEKLTHIDYQTYVQDSILAAAGCYDMHIGQNFKADRRANEVDYFEVKEAEMIEACDGTGRMTMRSNGGNNVSLLGGAGGWITSSAELLRFVAAINGESGKPDILSRKSINAMTYDSKRYKPMGWATVKNREWTRSGSMAGTSALIKRQNDGYTWVFISNSSTWNGFRISNYISSYITRSISKVSGWSDHDLFKINN